MRSDYTLKHNNPHILFGWGGLKNHQRREAVTRILSKSAGFLVQDQGGHTGKSPRGKQPLYLYFGLLVPC
jgi:methylmalonyl-CoA mutase cobalamin-binding subunit